jgi:hypothetical protein
MFIYLYRRYRKRQQQQQQHSNQAASAPISEKNAANCPHRQHDPAQALQKCAICAAEKSAARKYRWKMLLLLLPGFMLASLDVTIVATALPFIASHFGMPSLEADSGRLMEGR